MRQILYLSPARAARCIHQRDHLQIRVFHGKSETERRGGLLTTAARARRPLRKRFESDTALAPRNDAGSKGYLRLI